MKNYEIKNATIVEDDEDTKIVAQVKIGELNFNFVSSNFTHNSDVKYLNFHCKDQLLSGACKVMAIEEEEICDAVKEYALPIFETAVNEMKTKAMIATLEWWKDLAYWDFIEGFKKEIPADCTVEYLTYEEGVEMIKEGKKSLRLDDDFPTIEVKTPYSNRSIRIEKRAAYPDSWSYNRKPSYIYYDITAGYDEKLGRPRKLENISQKVLKAINAFRDRFEYQKKELEKKNAMVDNIASKLDDSFVCEEERKYSAYNRKHSWTEMKFKNENLSCTKVGDKFKVVVVPALDEEKINKLNEFMKTL